MFYLDPSGWGGGGEWIYGEGIKSWSTNLTSHVGPKRKMKRLMSKKKEKMSLTLSSHLNSLFQHVISTHRPRLGGISPPRTIFGGEN